MSHLIFRVTEVNECCGLKFYVIVSDFCFKTVLKTVFLFVCVIIGVLLTIKQAFSLNNDKYHETSSDVFLRLYLTCVYGYR